MPRLRVSNLGKRFKRYERPSARLWEWASAGRIRRFDESWALRDVSFEVQPGQAVGLVGANGAGKSTLVKLIRGTLRPNEGKIECRGRMAALELGLGFHPDFTGRQNLRTSGPLLGIEAAQLHALEPEIENFAEIGAYIDQPVRTYSTGMQMRLAFSLATAVRPDLLVIDEALSVGDAYFSQKCVTRIRHFREEGTALLLASHDPGAIKTLCDHAVLLDAGVLIRQGDPVRVLEYYTAMIAQQTADYEIRQGEKLGNEGGSTRSGDGRSQIESVELIGEDGPTRAFRVGSPMTVRVEGRAEEAIDDLTVGISLRDRLGNEIFGTNTYHLKLPRLKLAAGTRFRAEFNLPANLGYGNYNVTAALHAGEVHLEGNYDWWDNVAVFQVLPGGEAPFVGSAFLAPEAKLEVLG